MSTTINNYADLQALLNSFVAANNVTPGLAPHGVFWGSLTYEEFITGNVPGNIPGGPFKILEVGNAAKSNLIMALSGTPGSTFDPNTGNIGQMPQPNAPYNSETPTQTAIIAEISTWINAGCPNNAPLATEVHHHHPKK